MKTFTKLLKASFLTWGTIGVLLSPTTSYAYPVFAQQAYESPREATGRIVCANCHLAQKPVEVEVPQAVLPDSVFETVVNIPLDYQNVKQLSAAGTPAPLNVGAVVILPEGFKLAPKERLSDELKEKTKSVFIQPYSKTKPNILVVGPILGEKNKEIIARSERTRDK
jgi:apocytochrome f